MFSLLHKISGNLRSQQKPPEFPLSSQHQQASSCKEMNKSSNWDFVNLVNFIFDNFFQAVRKAPPQHQAQAGGHHGDRSQQQLPKEPEIATVSFNKVKGSMGLSIVEATPKVSGVLSLCRKIDLNEWSVHIQSPNIKLCPFLEGFLEKASHMINIL